LGGCGTTSDALSFSGYSSTYSPTTEQWSGTAWATTSGINVARYGIAGCGTISDALSFGGSTGLPAAVATSEK